MVLDFSMENLDRAVNGASSPSSAHEGSPDSLYVPRAELTKLFAIV